MTKRIRIGVWLGIGVLLCFVSAAVVLAGVAMAPFSITSHDPTVHEVGVPLTATIQATFDEDVNTGTVSHATFVVHGNLGGLVTGTFGYDGGTRTGTLDPDRPFHAGEVLRVSATSGISSTGGAALTPYGWQFTAGPVRDRGFARFASIGAGLSRVLAGSVAWGDYDNDGDLDILLTGHDGSTAVCEVYRNDGGGTFTGIGAGLTGVQQSSVAWGDYDNDGDLDILLTGADSSDVPVSKVYRNDGGAFTAIAAVLTGVVSGSAAWGDYDNDGDLDILLTGYSALGRVSTVYRNDDPAGFTDIGAGLTDVNASSVAWGDYDNDGDLDILLTGDAGDPQYGVSKVYRNDGPSGFTDIGAGLVGVGRGSVAWGDYDNDGDLDILLSGQDNTPTPVSRVYRNDGGSTFSDVGAGLTGVSSSSVAWGDYDNDGDLDILLTGIAGTYPNDYRVSKVYRNDAAGSGFTDIGAGLTGVDFGSVAWGDHDNDGDLDILLTGRTSSARVSELYRNNSHPQLGSVAPASGSGPVGTTTYFTTTWSDPDGWQNLKQLYFHIGDSPSLAGNVTLLYNAVKNRLWLLDDAGTGWQGGCYPEAAVAVFNGQATLHCSQTTVQGVGDTLSVTWAIEFQAGFEGDKKLGLKCKDRDKATAKGKWKGTWTIAP